jgi:hypothetical protein
MTTDESFLDQGGPAQRGPTRARDHRGTAVLSLQECLVKLASTTLGRVAFLHDGSVVVFPVNYVVDGLSVVFRSTYGTKLQLAEDSGPVTFEIDHEDRDGHTGWSVLVQGVARIVDDPVAATRFHRLGLRPALADDPTGQWIQIRVEQITGRELVTPD